MAKKKCRRCFECKGRSHHWMENTEAEHPEDAEYLCKHCEIKGTECPDCDGDGYSRKPSLGDEPCELCKGEGVLEMEVTSPGGIVLPKMPEPEPTPEPQEDKPKRWCFTVGFYPFESSDQHAKKALEVLYAIGLGRRGFKQESWEKRERVRELLDQLSQEMVGEVPSIEELC